MKPLPINNAWRALPWHAQERRVISAEFDEGGMNVKVGNDGGMGGMGFGMGANTTSVGRHGRRHGRQHNIGWKAWASAQHIGWAAWASARARKRCVGVGGMGVGTGAPEVRVQPRNHVGMGGWGTGNPSVDVSGASWCLVVQAMTSMP
jgi:hypothetical protein